VSLHPSPQQQVTTSMREQPSVNLNNHATYSTVQGTVQFSQGEYRTNGDGSETGFHRLTKHIIIAIRFKSTNNGHYHSFRQVSQTAGKLNTIFDRFIDYTHIHTYTIYIISVRSVCQITCMFDK